LDLERKIKRIKNQNQAPHKRIQKEIKKKRKKGGLDINIDIGGKVKPPKVDGEIKIDGGMKLKFPNVFLDNGKKFRIKSTLGNHYLHVQGPATNGTPITLWNKTGLESNPEAFKWTLHTTNGGYHIRSVLGNGEFALHQHGNTNNNGDKCTIWNISAGQQNLVVNFEPTLEGTWFIKFNHSGKYIHLPASSLTDGTGIVQWEHQNTAPFKWEFEGVDFDLNVDFDIGGKGGFKFPDFGFGKKDKKSKSSSTSKDSKGNKKDKKKDKTKIGIDVEIGGSRKVKPPKVDFEVKGDGKVKPPKVDGEVNVDIEDKGKGGFKFPDFGFGKKDKKDKKDKKSKSSSTSKDSKGNKKDKKKGGLDVNIDIGGKVKPPKVDVEVKGDGKIKPPKVDGEVEIKGSGKGKGGIHFPDFGFGKKDKKDKKSKSSSTSKDSKGNKKDKKKGGIDVNIDIGGKVKPPKVDGEVDIKGKGKGKGGIDFGFGKKDKKSKSSSKDSKGNKKDKKKGGLDINVDIGGKVKPPKVDVEIKGDGKVKEKAEIVISGQLKYVMKVDEKHLDEWVKVLEDAINKAMKSISHLEVKGKKHEKLDSSQHVQIEAGYSLGTTIQSNISQGTLQTGVNTQISGNANLGGNAQISGNVNLGGNVSGNVTGEY